MGRRVGRFEIEKELGRGAQSIVYLGSDPQLQRQVAIKTLHFARPDPAQNHMLLAEARTVSRLRHANIVPIFDAGEQDGDVYLVFEYVPGQNLGDFLKTSGALTPVRAVTLLRPILDAVAAAHAQGVIHRDLKPTNIILDDNGTPRVMDFGIAARVDSGDEASEEYTGTPAYMAPEYIEHRQISEATDVFAAGLILYELLTGRRAVEGGNVFQIMHRLASEDVRLPESASPAIDDALAGIVHKALARNPEMRFKTVRQFAEALENYLEPEVSDDLRAAGKQSTVDFLLRRMRHKSDFPALSESVTAINKIAASETESIGTLSNTILKDFSLTNKLLRLVNTAHFRPAGGGNISTVSRAVIVLGVEAVRNIAITVLLFEHMQNKANLVQLKEDFLRANLAAVLAKDIGVRGKSGDVEQVFICALFQNLGRLLAQYYFADESEEIRRLMSQKPCSEEQAARQVLGMSLEDLGREIARTWGFPPLILGSMQRLASGPVRKPNTQEERMRVVAGCANELCEAMSHAGPEAREKAMRAVSTRFAAAVALDEQSLREAVLHAIEEVSEFARIIHLNLKQTVFGRVMQQMVNGGGSEGTLVGEAGSLDVTDTLGETMLGEGGLAIGSLESEGNGEALPDAEAVLTAGIQDISNTLVEGFQLNDILRIILETMYRAMGFKRVVLAIKDARANAMHGRFGFGPETGELARRFRFLLTPAQDVFYVAVSKGVDLMISDVDDPKIAPRIPEWYRQAVAAKTFILFPLNIKGNPVALIYADKDNAGDISVAEKELSLLRTLRNQAVLAIKQGT